MKQQTAFMEGASNNGPILSRLWTKVHEVLGDRREAPGIQRLSPIVYSLFLCEVILEVVEKPNKCIQFLAPIFQEG